VRKRPAPRLFVVDRCQRLLGICEREQRLAARGLDEGLVACSHITAVVLGKTSRRSSLPCAKHSAAE
jgi:hypothetical protein